MNRADRSILEQLVLEDFERLWWSSTQEEVGSALQEQMLEAIQNEVAALTPYSVALRTGPRLTVIRGKLG